MDEDGFLSIMYFYILIHICSSSNIHQLILLFARMSRFSINILPSSHFYKCRCWEALFTLIRRRGCRSFVWQCPGLVRRKENWDIFLGLWLQREAWNDFIAYEYKPFVKISSQSTFARKLEICFSAGLNLAMSFHSLNSFKP